MKQFYVLGYPKSGTTWLWKLLLSVPVEVTRMHPKPSSLNINIKSSICIVRDVRDVIISLMYFYYLQQAGPNFVINPDRSMINKFINQVYEGEILYVGNLSWSEYINDALNIDNLKIIKYEDLWFHTKNTFCSILEHLNITTNKMIHIILEQNDFEYRKKMYKEKGDGYNYKFLRRGIPGQYKEFMTEEQIKRCNDLFGNEMKELRYEL